MISNVYVLCREFRQSELFPGIHTLWQLRFQQRLRSIESRSFIHSLNVYCVGAAEYLKAVDVESMGHAIMTSLMFGLSDLTPKNLSVVFNPVQDDSVVADDSMVGGASGYGMKASSNSGKQSAAGAGATAVGPKLESVVLKGNKAIIAAFATVERYSNCVICVGIINDTQLSHGIFNYKRYKNLEGKKIDINDIIGTSVC